MHHVLNPASPETNDEFWKIISLGIMCVHRVSRSYGSEFGVARKEIRPLDKDSWMEALYSFVEIIRIDVIYFAQFWHLVNCNLSILENLIILVMIL